MRIFKISFILIVLFTLVACSQIAILMTPKKKATSSHSVQSKKAESEFWDTLHHGNYSNIPHTTESLTQAYLENPNDPTLAAHLGFLHIWKLTERQRLEAIPATITDHAILSKKYFSDAVQLNSNDARFLGFLGDAELAEGKIFNDERQQTKGYFTLKQAISEWPEFNYFTAGYLMSMLPSDSEYFKEGLNWQWKTLDLCAMTSVDHNNPTFEPYMKLATTTPPKSACWNSWVAPYNFEGFFLNMGDMLVKSGDWKTAIKIYNNAKLAPNYSTWPYRKLLENHIAHAKENVTQFNVPTPKPAEEKAVDRFIRDNHKILFLSGYGCAACHQNKN